MNALDLCNACDAAPAWAGSPGGYCRPCETEARRGHDGPGGVPDASGYYVEGSSMYASVEAPTYGPGGARELAGWPAPPYGGVRVHPGIGATAHLSDPEGRTLTVDTGGFLHAPDEVNGDGYPLSAVEARWLAAWLLRVADNLEAWRAAAESTRRPAGSSRERA